MFSCFTYISTSVQNIQGNRKHSFKKCDNSVMTSMEVPYEFIRNKILSENFTNVFRSGYINIKGITMPERFKDFYKNIEDWEVYDDDVWICSFPKTGTTWTQEMVWMIMNNLDFEGAKTSLGERFPFLDYSVLFDYRKILDTRKDFDAPVYLIESINYVANKKRPRFIKTHLPWNLLPKEIQSGKKQPKMIYIIRNPKDVCVSYYYHAKLFEGYTGNFNDFCELFFTGKLCFAPYWENVMQFWERRHQQNILFLKYEDLKNDLPSSIHNVAIFLGKQLNEEQVKQLAEHLKFDNMKNNKAVNYETLVEFNQKFKLIEQAGSFMRSGAVGDHQAEMSEELIGKFDAWISEHAANNSFGY